MSKAAFATLFMGLLLGGCTQDSPQAIGRFHDDGRAKPIVSLVPLIDHSSADIPWNLSDELTSAITYRLNQKKNIFLVDKEAVKTIVRSLSDEEHPFKSDLNWMKTSFRGHEFVAFLELIEHDRSSHPTLKDSYAGPNKPMDLNMTVRVRVVDLRESVPHVILQEIIQRSHHIPRQFADMDYNTVQWGRDNYSISPLGLAHSELAKEVASRLEDYLLIAKSH